MSKKEKDIIEAIIVALPNMSEFDKGYFLGVAESKANDIPEQKEVSMKKETVST